MPINSDPIIYEFKIGRSREFHLSLKDYFRDIDNDNIILIDGLFNDFSTNSTLSWFSEDFK